MSGTSTPTNSHQTVEFKGHLIDSLTLSKIADHIEQLGGSYELNDLRIGSQRQDISSINMTLYADTPEQLTALIADLTPYGAIPTGQSDADTLPCMEDGVLPTNAFSLRVPQRVFINRQWIDINAGQAFTLVISPANNQARLCQVSELRKGDLVISGNHGIEW